MSTQEKERLGLALAVSLVIHVVAFLIVQFGDWRVAPLPEFSGPLYVEMEPIEEEPEAEEGIAETRTRPEQPADAPASEAPAEEPPAEEPPPRQPAPPEPAPEETAPATAQPRQSEPPARAEPEARQPAPAAGPSGADPLAGERQTEDFDVFGREDRPGQRTAPPESDEMPQLSPEADATAAKAELPDWATAPRQSVEEAGISTEGVSDSEVQDLAEKVATDPAFRRRLQEVTAALERRTSAGTTGDRAPRDGPDTDPREESSTEDRSPGDSRFEWVGTGNRQLTNPPAVPQDFFSSADFGGSVPAEASFVVVFEVDQRGNVVPGSVIFQQGSGYVIAKEKLRGRIRGWSFEQTAPNADIATGIFTLVVQREDVP